MKNNLTSAIVIVAMLVLGFVGIIVGYVMRVMSYPYSNIVAWVSGIIFLLAILMPLFIPNSKENTEEIDENILDRNL